MKELIEMSLAERQANEDRFRRIRAADERRRQAEVARLSNPTEEDVLKWLEWVNGAA